MPKYRKGTTLSLRVVGSCDCCGCVNMSIFYLHIKDSKIVMAMVVVVCNSKLLVTKIVVAVLTSIVIITMRMRIAINMYELSHIFEEIASKPKQRVLVTSTTSKYKLIKLMTFTTTMRSNKLRLSVRLKSTAYQLNINQLSYKNYPRAIIAKSIMKKQQHIMV